jgi:hypothetical protein
MFHYVCNVKVNIFNLQLKKHIMKLNEQLSKQTPEWDVIVMEAWS